MIDSWLGQVERLALRVTTGNAGATGLMSLDGNAGVRTLSQMLCNVLAGATEVLRVDLAGTSQALTDGEEPTPDRMFALRHEGEEGEGFPTIRALHTTDTRRVFNGPKFLQQVWKERLSSHARIVVELPPVLHDRSDLLNPLATAASCDEVFLVCLQGRTVRWRLAEAVSLLRGSGVNLIGVVLNSRDYVGVGEEMGRTVRHLVGFAPRFASRIEGRLLQSRMLG